MEGEGGDGPPPLAVADKGGPGAPQRVPVGRGKAGERDVELDEVVKGGEEQEDRV